MSKRLAVCLLRVSFRTRNGLRGLLVCACICCPLALAWGQQEAFADSSGDLYLVPVTYTGGGGALGTPAPAAVGSVSGTVKDSSEVNIGGALVTLSTRGSAESFSAQSDDEGAFRFPAVAAGPYTLTVAREGFRPWTGSGILTGGETVNVPAIELAVSPVNTAIEVVASSREVAEAQLGFEEKQRVLGVFPDFYTSYLWNADPLTPRQKFRLAWRFSRDPVSIAIAGVVAGAEQGQKSFRGYGTGTEGYAKRLGATYADGLTSTMIGGAILPVIFHQDPRYFVKGTGSIPVRAMYAIATAVICRGDNRRWQLNYSNILGNIASASLSNVYYPASGRQGAELTVENSLMGTGLGAIGGLFQEFFLHRMTPNLPDYSGAAGQ